MKVCTSCGENKSVKEYYRHRKYKDGLKPRCKSCERIYEQRRYEEKKLAGAKFIKNKQSSQRSRHLRITYGITEDQYNELLVKQEYSCAICHRHESEFPRKLAIDHNHETGEIRGLLCQNCNHRVVGRHKESKLLRAAADYLDKEYSGWIVPKKKRKRKVKKFE